MNGARRLASSEMLTRIAASLLSIPPYFFKIPMFGFRG
jgi:hypothetical protein